MNARAAYTCKNCDLVALRSFDYCPDCKAGGVCFRITTRNAARTGRAPRLRRSLNEVEARLVARYPVPEPWNSALGGGLAAGSAILLTGRAGSGKTTEALALAAAVPGAVYLPCEPNQSAADLRTIAERAGLDPSRIEVGEPVDLAEACAMLAEHPQPPLAIVDSISILGEACEVWRALRAAAPGAAIVCIVHVNKDGQMAGREQLKHLADTVIEVTRRALITGKNRFAAGAARVRSPRLSADAAKTAKPGTTPPR